MNETYTVTLKDRRSFAVAEQGTPRAAVERAMLENAPVRINGTVVSGSAIATVEGGTGAGEYGPHLMASREGVSLIAASVFDRRTGESFWKGIARRNMAAEGSFPWRFRDEVIRMRRLLKTDDPDGVMDRLESATMPQDGIRPLRPPEVPPAETGPAAEAALEAAA